MRDDHVRDFAATQLVECFDGRARGLDMETGRPDQLGELTECLGLGVRDERSELPLPKTDYIRGAFPRNGYIARRCRKK